MKNKKYAFSLFCFLVISFWIFMMGKLIKKYYFIKPVEISSFLGSEMLSASEITEHWHGIYLEGGKIGYSVSTLEKEENGYIIKEKVVMKLNLMGSSRKVVTNIDSLTDLELRLRSFKFLFQSGDVEYKAFGVREGDRLKVDITSAGETLQVEFPFNETPQISSQLYYFLAKKGIETGKVFAIPIFDPSTMSKSKIEVKVISKESIPEFPEKETYRLNVNFRGIETSSWMTKDGDVLKEASSLGFTSIKENKGDALTKNWQQGIERDIIGFCAVPVQGMNLEGKNCMYLKVRFAGITLEGFDLDGGRQKLDGNILTVISSPMPEPEDIRYGEIMDKTNLYEYLKPTIFIQCNDPQIKKTAQKIIGENTDPLTVASKINTWIFKNIKKSPTVSIPYALQVLKSKEGDCNEHTTLFTALCRSVGIPARMCVGLVHMKGSFYYHAWPEVFLDRWRAVDPTLNQFPADATHLRFLIGGLDRQLDLIKIVRKLKIEILECKVVE
ncbi:MAG: transglutaminase-like domain-containing protein [Thermodesulfobacteriota bacterium]|nr:transglutaminase-like domain-containing protein [Thermodesulfobacteriota bacterium]